MTEPDLPLADTPMQVLLLDDDPFMLGLIEEMLGELGNFDVHAATDARRALGIMVETAPALLICDLSMPDMDGIELLHAAAANGFRGHVMLLSGMDSGVRRAAERLARSQGLAVLGAYKKPISMPDLAAALSLLGQEALP